MDINLLKLSLNTACVVEFVFYCVDAKYSA